MTINGITLTGNVFDGKYYAGRAINLSGTANEEGKAVIGWKVTGATSKEVQGSELTLTMPNGSIAINPIIGEASGINTIQPSDINHQTSDIYDLMGRKVKTPQAGRIYIQNGKKTLWR